MSTIKKLLKKEHSIYINPLFDAAKLREFTSGFKRHTIKRIIRPQNRLPNKNIILPLSERIRQSPSDYFQAYCRQAIP
jgi:hypothetical protein